MKAAACGTIDVVGGWWDRNMKRRDPAGWHDASGWRLLTATAVFMVLWGTVGIVIGAKFFAWMMLVFAPFGAFIGGYCFRQQVLSTGRLPRFRWLWLKEDMESQHGDRTERP